MFAMENSRYNWLINVFRWLFFTFGTALFPLGVAGLAHLSEGVTSFSKIMFLLGKNGEIYLVACASAAANTGDILVNSIRMSTGNRVQPFNLIAGFAGLVVIILSAACFALLKTSSSGPEGMFVDISYLALAFAFIIGVYAILTGTRSVEETVQNEGEDTPRSTLVTP